jgi:hypothetical protein
MMMMIRPVKTRYSLPLLFTEKCLLHDDIMTTTDAGTPTIVSGTPTERQPAKRYLSTHFPKEGRATSLETDERFQRFAKIHENAFQAGR